MVMASAEGGHGPSEVTCRIGGDRPGCDFMVTTLAERSADTGTSTGRFDVGVLAGPADVERDLIRTRTAEGRSRAQKRGQHMGRPPKVTPAQKTEARRRRAQGATLAELALSYGVGKSTISRRTA